ncbi:MAG: DUF2029 domain-containing protein [Methylacidiphilales bacterium]|nr:DUF2029 domain-containing protein [Candidatus Methylacidiphilales bacterium]
MKQHRVSLEFASLLLKILILLGYTIVLLRTAWTCDDAFITMRVVDNLANGHGLVWNTDERVQAYTHPLWLLLIAPIYFFTREAYFTLLALSAVLSIFSVALLLRMCGDRLWRVALIGIALIGSKSFVDFSTSGLENPLSHFLLALLCFSYLRAPQTKPQYWTALSGLLVLNRLDFVLLIVPLLLDYLRHADNWVKRWRALLLVFGPALVWMGFSTLYYGFPLPNTFYAKQYADIPRSEYLARGVAYFYDFITNDPLSFVTIVCGTILGVIASNRRTLWPLSLSIVLYAVYVFWIGGDFMRGRFFSAPFVIAVACLSQAPTLTPFAPPVHRHVFRVMGLVAAFGLSSLAKPVPTWLSGYPYPADELFRPVHTPLSQLVSKLIGRGDLPVLLSHVIDERGFYYEGTGLLPRLNGSASVENFLFSARARLLRIRRPEILVVRSIGYFGFFSYPSTKIIDLHALSDALLARLPLDSESQVWRIGHIPRYLPDGYIPTRIYGKNQIRNHQIRRLYDDIHLVIAGPLFSVERLKAIVRLNLRPTKVDPSLLDKPLQDVTRFQFGSTLYPVPKQGLNIYMDAREPITSSLLLIASAGTSYTLTARLAGDDTPSSIVKELPLSATATGPHRRYQAHLVDLTEQPVRYNLLQLLPFSGARDFQAGYLRLLDSIGFLQHQRLITDGITLSSTIGINATDPLPRLIQFELLAGAWWADAQTLTEIELVLSRPQCSNAASERVDVWVNHVHLATHTWDLTRCSEKWATVISVDPHILRSGWNLLEIDVHQRASVAVERIWISSSQAHTYRR